MTLKSKGSPALVPKPTTFHCEFEHGCRVNAMTAFTFDDSMTFSHYHQIPVNIYKSVMKGLVEDVLVFPVQNIEHQHPVENEAEGPVMPPLIRMSSFSPIHYSFHKVQPCKEIQIHHQFNNFLWVSKS